MDLSAFSVVDADAAAESAGRERFAELLGLAEAADRAGLRTFWVAEHHFVPPTGLCPSPAIVLAAAGMRTSRIRLGCMVCVLPFHSPIDIAETYSLLDQLTGGRLDFGVGSGYLPAEFEGFGLDPASKRERFDGALPTILAGMAGRPMPIPGGGGRTVNLNVRARQQPHPPVWIAAQRREALPHVARQGASLALIPYATVSSIEELHDEIREFRAAAPAPRNVRVSAAVHVYAGDRPELARAALQRYLDGRLATHSTHYEAKVQRDPRHASAEAIEAGGFAAFGEPERVVKQLDRFREAGVDELLGIFDFGGLAFDEVRGSVERLAAAWPRS